MREREERGKDEGRRDGDHLPLLELVGKIKGKKHFFFSIFFEQTEKRCEVK
jgi:hypothetical protein